MTQINPKAADFWFVHNNGVTALRPNLNGRFGAMVRQKDDGGQKCWTFMDPSVYEGTVSQADLRAAHGNRNELDELKEWMSERGITWATHGGTASSYVPFSNGAWKVVSRRPDGVAEENDYADSEYAWRRDDSPRMAIEAWFRPSVIG